MKLKPAGLFSATALILVTMLSGAARPQDQRTPQGNQGQCKGCAGQGQGQGQMRGRMMGMMGQGQMQNMQTIHALFDHHDKITRTVKNT